MRGFRVLIIIFVLVTMLTFGAGSIAQGQDAVTCDSDLTLLWYVAERYFAFGAVQNSLGQTAVDPATVLDLNRFNQGQFAPLFTALRSAQDPNTGTLPGVTLTQEWMNSVLATMLMDETSFQDFLNGMQADPSAITPLVPAAVGGEATECTQLRSQLQRFFAAVTFQELQTGFNTGVAINGNVNANINGNVNANANTNGNVNATGNVNANANVNGNDNSGAAPAPDANANTNANVNANANDNTGGGGDNTNDNIGGGDNSGSGGGDNSGSGNSGSGGGGDDSGSGSSGSGGGGNSGSGGGD